MRDVVLLAIAAWALLILGTWLSVSGVLDTPSPPQHPVAREHDNNCGSYVGYC